MTILLYDHIELEERTSKHLKVWKAWHIILYAFAAIFGILNYIFLQSTMQLADNNCVLYPRQLAFHMVEISNFTEISNSTETKELDEITKVTTSFKNENATSKPENVAQTSTVAVPTDKTADEEKAKIVKREAIDNETYDEFETTIVVDNVTIVIANSTHRLVLDSSRTLYGPENACQFAEYMPILSTIFAAVWATMFTMCPSGGRARSGLQQPWRILTPALLFALVMVGLTGHSFTTTNRGLYEFCSSFYNVTNATTCSPVSPFLERAWSATWGLGGRAAATRAASAGTWAGWACAAALLLARCLAAPDFTVKRTGVYLTKDPQQKITPHLKRSPRRSQRSTQSSPTKRDNGSVKSEPTVTTELVTVSVEHGEDSVPTSIMATPIKHQQRDDIMEMTYNPRERFGNGR